MAKTLEAPMQHPMIRPLLVILALTMLVYLRRVMIRMLLRAAKVMIQAANSEAKTLRAVNARAKALTVRLADPTENFLRKAKVISLEKSRENRSPAKKRPTM
jgi:hypothetical protein